MIVWPVLQSDDYSCGPACAIMVIQYYEGGILAPEVRERIRFSCLGGRGGTTQGRLVRTLREWGLRVGVRRGAGIDDYRRAFYYERPCIIYHNRCEHWCVAVAEDESRIVANDPLESTQQRYGLDELSTTFLEVIGR